MLCIWHWEDLLWYTFCRIYSEKSLKIDGEFLEKSGESQKTSGDSLKKVETVWKKGRKSEKSGGRENSEKYWKIMEEL